MPHDFRHHANASVDAGAVRRVPGARIGALPQLRRHARPAIFAGAGG